MNDEERVSISIGVLNKVVNVLGTMRYVDVKLLLDEVDKDVQPLVNNELNGASDRGASAVVGTANDAALD